MSKVARTPLQVPQIGAPPTALKFATELQAQWAGRQSEGLVTAFALHYSWVYRRKGYVHRINMGVAGGGQSYSVSSALYRSVRLGWPKKRPMLRFIGLRVFARAVSPPYVRSWYWPRTSKAQHHSVGLYLPLPLLLVHSRAVSSCRCQLDHRLQLNKWPLHMLLVLFLTSPPQ